MRRERLRGPALPRRRGRGQRARPRPCAAGSTWSSCATRTPATTRSPRGRRFRALCDEHGALFWLNDRPDLASNAGGGRRARGPGRPAVPRPASWWARQMLIGLSTHSPGQFDAALASDADQLQRGPGLGDAHQGGSARRPGSTTCARRRARRGRALVRDRGHRPGQRASRWWPPARGESSWCERSRRPADPGRGGCCARPAALAAADPGRAASLAAGDAGRRRRVRGCSSHAGGRVACSRPE